MQISNRLRYILLVFTVCLLGATSCTDDVSNSASQEVLTFNVAIVCPMDNLLARTDNERIVKWCLSNIERAQDGLKKKIKLNIEWYDENTPDYNELCVTLSKRQDLLTIINMASSDKCTQMAYECAQTKQNLILPTASSTELVRKFSNRKFLWTLVETDVTQCEILLSQALKEEAHSVSLLAYEGAYGKTFVDWFAFQATELGLKIGSIETYRDANGLQNALSRIPEKSHVICALNSPDDIVQLKNTNDKLYAEKQLQYIFTDSSFDVSLLDNMVDLLFANIRGVSYYADPESGFKIAYEKRFGSAPFSHSAHLYDAVMLTAFGAAFMASHEGVSIYESISEVTENEHRSSQVLAWEGFGMRETFQDISKGGPMNIDIKGATGNLNFDDKVKTSVVSSTYCSWQIGIYENSDLPFIYINEFITSNGTYRTAPNLASWNWDVTLEDFDVDHPVFPHPVCSDQWALVVASSTGWTNYRHQADALRMYQELKRQGFDDRHIILVINDDLANNPNNPTPGILIAPDGENIYKNVTVDYRTSELSISDLKDIINGHASKRLPEVIPSDSTNNVLVFWSGHGRSSGELCWHELHNGITANTMYDMLKEAADNKRFRKMLWMVEACYSEAVMRAIEGLPNILCYTAANSYEESKADIYDFNYKTYLTNRFTTTMLETYAADPDISMRDLYYKMAHNTIASHVCVINKKQNDNLFLTIFGEFVRRAKP